MTNSRMYRPLALSTGIRGLLEGLQQTEVVLGARTVKEQHASAVLGGPLLVFFNRHTKNKLFTVCQTLTVRIRSPGLSNRQVEVLLLQKKVS